MSHLVNGFCIKDIQALADTVKSQCPELELVESNTYRTWITDHGQLVGDHPIPGLYQAVLAKQLKDKGIDIVAIAAKKGITLPANILELETKPWNLSQQRRLLEDESVKAAYDDVVKNRMSKDAKYCIRYKDKQGPEGAYEIGLVPHPFRAGEFVMMTDFYAQGNGLLRAKGLGKYTQKAGVDSWANELKQGYAVRATERAINRQVAMHNPAYSQVTKKVLADGRIVYEVRGK